MRSSRSSNLLVGLGSLALALAIGEGQHQSARARERRDPVLWQVSVLDARGQVLRAREGWGSENSALTLDDDAFGPRPRLQIELLPLGLPNGDLDVELHLTIGQKRLPPLQGLRVTPGTPIRMDVPGESLRLEIRALRGEPGRPLVS